MEHDILHYAKSRYTAKAYDPTQKIPEHTVQKLKELLRLSPSSTNSQPWHFIIADKPDGRERIAKSTDETYAFNSLAVRNASHVVVFATRLAMTEEHLNAVLSQEEKDGRFDADTDAIKAERRQGMDGGRRRFVNLHAHQFRDLQHWMDKQVYLNIGQFLLGAAALGVDATPMEGFDMDILNAEFGLYDKGYTALVIVTLGYRDSENDYNETRPKSRLPLSYTMTHA